MVVCKSLLVVVGGWVGGVVCACGVCTVVWCGVWCCLHGVCGVLGNSCLEARKARKAQKARRCGCVWVGVGVWVGACG